MKYVDAVGAQRDFVHEAGTHNTEYPKYEECGLQAKRAVTANEQKAWREHKKPG